MNRPTAAAVGRVLAWLVVGAVAFVVCCALYVIMRAPWG